MEVLNLINVTKKYNNLIVLQNVSFQLQHGESVALVAQSGAGKSTLLQIAATLEKPTSGQVLINMSPTSELSDAQKSNLRSNYIGFIYQFHNLLPDFSALENVMLPLLIQKIPMKKAKEKALYTLECVKLIERQNHLPNQLSGGEQQRVAIARAIVTSPSIILADEPTGNLDPETAHSIFDLFLKLINKNKMSLIMATHNLELAQKMQRKITIFNKQIIEI